MDSRLRGNDNMRLVKPFLVLTIAFILISCNEGISVGAEQTALYEKLLKDKKVALVVNQTSVVKGQHLITALTAKKIAVAKIFTPEHGFEGQLDAGESVGNSQHKKTDIPIVSLYGKKKKPLPEDLKGIEVIVFDIQDVGIRFYTYISTLHFIMEACAENNIKLIVLDRPNPNGRYIDGPILDMSLKSFVGMHPIPIVYGMTIGELATMINGEEWLAKKSICDLTVIPVKNWNHRMSYHLEIPPSPNLKTDVSIALYPSLCLFEGTNVSVGRGTDHPFELIGHPQHPIQNFKFIPQPNRGAKNPKHNGKVCFGNDLSKTTPQYLFTLSYLIDFYQKSPLPQNFFNDYFNKLAGNRILKQQIIDGMSEKEIKKTWTTQLEKFKKTRKKYLLYED